MTKSSFVEDIIESVISNFDQISPLMTSNDTSAFVGFYNVVTSNKPFTQNQANFILKMLNKYRVPLKNVGIDCTEVLQNPNWKHPFRTLDLTKHVSIEKNPDGELVICLKFPFALKEAFEKEVTAYVRDYTFSKWDADRKIRVVKMYDYNLIEVGEFVVRHGFNIDDTFLSALSEVEQFWQNQDHILPYSLIIDGKVQLVNSPPEADEYWVNNSTNNEYSNMLLAKSMGYPLRVEKSEKTKIEAMAGSSSSHFWIKEISDFFNIHKQVNGTVAVVLNKGDDYIQWVKDFVEKSAEAGISKEDIRVCFRLDKQEDRGFNQWVKDQGIGGKVEGAKIFIFQNKPPKWLFSSNTNVTIIATNSLYPVPSSTTQAWMNNHPCVCYLGPIKASNARERKIVEL